MEEENIIDKINNDKNKIVIGTKSVKWIIGLLSFSVTGLLGFAWGLYIKVDSKVDSRYKQLEDTIIKTESNILNRIEKLDNDKIKPNSDKNYRQDMDIIVLYERIGNKSTTRTYSIVDTINTPPSLIRR